jgi:hypothetical protein
MSEAHVLRRFYWQLFVTLTFVKPPTTRASSLPQVFTWIRDVARSSDVHFKRLMWVLRFEFGSVAGRAHYHLCLAGIPPASLGQRFCQSLESGWRTRGGGLAEVALYNQERDGVGYILKLPHFFKGSSSEPARSSEVSGDDCEPMLSDSLIQAMTRGRM